LNRRQPGDGCCDWDCASGGGTWAGSIAAPTIAIAAVAVSLDQNSRFMSLFLFRNRLCNRCTNL
jgi:hypothetical protein